MKEGKETNFGDVYAYMRNDLAPERMREVARSIRENGEVELVFHQLLFDNLYNKEHVESLIGADDEDFEKNFSENCKNSGNTALKEKQTDFINLKNGEIMATTEEKAREFGNLGAVTSAIEALSPEIEKMMLDAEDDFEAFARKELIDRLDITDEIAQQIVDGLKEGIGMFDQQSEALRENGQLAENIGSLLEGKTDEEKKNLMVQALAALRVLENAPGSDWEADPQADQEALQKAREEYGKLSYEELAALFERTLKEGNCFEHIVTALLPTRKPIGKEAMAAFRRMMEHQGDTYRLCVALALYMGHCEQKVNLSVDENNLDPRVVGASAAAAVAVVNISDEKDEATWRMWMKIILGGLYYVIMVILCTTAVTVVAMAVGTMLMLMFGQGVIAALIAFGITVAVSISLANKLIEFTLWSMEALEEPYERAVDFLVERFQLLKTWIADKRGGGTVETVETAAPEKQAAEEPVAESSVEETEEKEEEPIFKQRGFETGLITN